MDFGGLDSAAVGGIVGAGVVLLGGLIWWCQRRYAIYIVKQRRSRRWKAQRTLIGAVPRPALKILGRTHMKTLVATTRPPMILQDPKLVRTGSAPLTPTGP